MKRCLLLVLLCGFLDFISFSISPSVEGLLPYSPVFRQNTVLRAMWGSVLLLGAEDMDGDGAVDIVFCHRGHVAILPGRGDGTFASQELLWTYEGKALAGKLSDLDGDGIKDIVLVVRRGDGVRLHFLGNRGGTLDLQADLRLPWEPSGILVGDWDGDEMVDVLLFKRADEGGVDVFLVRGFGNGIKEPEFWERIDGQPVEVVGGMLVVRGREGAFAVDISGEAKGKVVVEGSTAYRVCPVDLDLDGGVDLVLATSLGTFVSFWDEGGWGPPKAVWVGKATDVVVGDFNADGHPDLLVRRGGSGVWVIWANVGGGFAGPAGEVFLPAPRNLFPTDLDGNGTTDLVMDYLYSIVVLTSGGKPVGESWLPMEGSALIGLGDLSGDGTPELLAWGRDGFEVHWNNGRGGFIRERFAPGMEITPIAAQIRSGQLFVLGVDEEGAGIAVGMSPRGEMLFRRELGPSPAPGFVVSDLDGDGELDLLGLGPREIRVLWGLEKSKVYRWKTGELSLAAATGGEVYLVSTGEYAEVYRVSFPRRALRVEGPLLRLESVPLAMGVGELDGDGTPDVVLACLRFFREGDAIDKGMELGLVLSRLGMKVLVPELPAGEVPLPLAGLAVGDFDGDGRGDLGISTASGNGAYLLFGDGEGNFLPRVSEGPAGEVYPVLEKVGPVFAADLDGDGRDELVASTVGLGPFIKILWGGGGG